MPEFESFSITLDPKNISVLASKAADAYASKSDESSLDAFQAKSFTESVNLVQQAAIITNPDLAREVVAQSKKIDSDLKEEIKVIYGKAAQIQGNRAEVAMNYEENSKKDSNRFNNLAIQLDNQKPILITELTDKAAKQYNKTYQTNITKESVTMDMIVDYVQTAHKVSISEKQRDFLSSQWNQAGLRGVAESLRSAGIRDKNGNISSIVDPDHPKMETFVFKDGKLASVRFTQNIKGLGEFEGKRSISIVEANISNLASATKSLSRASRSTEEYLPNESPASVVISYKSKDGEMPCSISSELHKAIDNHAKFKAVEAIKFVDISLDEPSKVNAVKAGNRFSRIKEAFSQVAKKFSEFGEYIAKTMNNLTSVFKIKAKEDVSNYRMSEVRDSMVRIDEVRDSFSSGRSSSVSLGGYIGSNHMKGELGDVKTIDTPPSTPPSTSSIGERKNARVV